MSFEQATDCFMTGASIVPGCLAFADEPALAMMALIVLLIAGALCSLCDPGAPHRRARPPRG